MMPDDLYTQMHKLDFAVQKWKRYHERRSSFYDKIDKGMKVLFFLSGSAVIPNVPIYLAVAAPVIVSIDMLFSVSRRARDHKMMCNGYSELEAEIKAMSHTEELHGIWVKRRQNIDAMNSGSLYKALEAYCYNEVRRFWRQDEELVEMTSWQKLTMNLCPHTGGAFKRYSPEPSQQWAKTPEQVL